MGERWVGVQLVAFPGARAAVNRRRRRGSPDRRHRGGCRSRQSRHQQCKGGLALANGDEIPACFERLAGLCGGMDAAGEMGDVVPSTPSRTSASSFDGPGEVRGVERPRDQRRPGVCGSVHCRHQFGARVGEHDGHLGRGWQRLECAEDHVGPVGVGAPIGEHDRQRWRARLLTGSAEGARRWRVRRARPPSSLGWMAGRRTNLEKPQSIQRPSNSSSAAVPTGTRSAPSTPAFPARPLR